MNAELLLAAFFFPLFPFSAVFMLLYKKQENPWLKNALIIFWPMVGLYLVYQFELNVPVWMQYWAVLTSVFYALRSLVIRDMELWTGFMAVSLWAVLWTVYPKHDINMLFYSVLGLSLPLSILILLGSELRKRFDSVYAGLIGGIADSLPRLSRMLVITLLAVIATPVFPGFFVMLVSIVDQMLVVPMIAVALVISWFFWTWSGVRLLQGLITGPAHESDVEDLGVAPTLFYGVALAVLVLLGLFLAGDLL